MVYFHIKTHDSFLVPISKYLANPCFFRIFFAGTINIEFLNIIIGWFSFNVDRSSYCEEDIVIYSFSVILVLSYVGFFNVYTMNLNSNDIWEIKEESN